MAASNLGSLRLRSQEQLEQRGDMKRLLESFTGELLMKEPSVDMDAKVIPGVQRVWVDDA